MRILSYMPVKQQKFKNFIIPSTKNPVKIFRMMKLYSIERQEKFPRAEAFINTLFAIFSKCKMKAINDNTGHLLASYTYKLRKNRRGENAIYINTLVRNRKNSESKNIMKTIYQDIKQTAENAKAEEITLFSVLKDKKLQSNYETHGFTKDDKVFIPGGYIMRVKTKDFLI